MQQDIPVPNDVEDRSNALPARTRPLGQAFIGSPAVGVGEAWVHGRVPGAPGELFEEGWVEEFCDLREVALVQRAAATVHVLQYASQ